MKRKFKNFTFCVCATVVLSAWGLWAQSPIHENKADQGAASSTLSTSNSKNSDASRDFILGADDVIAINVWKEPELSRVVPVRPDGEISLPLIGEIKAGGLRPRELQETITKGLEKYVSHPEVTVIVQEIRSVRFNITGEVVRPGLYPLTSPTTVLDAIALAGGFKDFVKPNKMYIIRKQRNGEASRIRFDYKAALKNSDKDSNLQLEPGDIIVVP